MFHDSFKPMSQSDAQDFMSAASPLLDGAPFGAATPRVLVRSLPFYAGYELVEAQADDIHPPMVRAFIRQIKGNVITVLNWTNEPIYHLNETVPIALTHDTATLYVKFFFTYVKGMHGRFLIVDNPDEIDWKDEPPPAGRKALAKMIEPLSIIRQDQDGVFHLQASMVFKDSLFAAKIAVTPRGQVSLYDEEMLVEDIPIRDDTSGL